MLGKKRSRKDDIDVQCTIQGGLVRSSFQRFMEQHYNKPGERFWREIATDKFWYIPEGTELQCVPSSFKSVDEYVEVFEPLLFEECRAQLHTSWEAPTKTVRGDVNTMVSVDNVRRQGRGWYAITLIGKHVGDWNIKEGDTAVLSPKKPGTGASAVSEHVIGLVWRHTASAANDPPRVVFYYYIGNSCSLNSKVDEDHILEKFQLTGVWHLTLTGSLTTAQREYVALHSFQLQHLQMQSLILKPSPESFPEYDKPPCMPQIFTEKFVNHLHRSFNGPQLTAIQRVAMHTATGTGSGMSKQEGSSPFTLVQGPPGTGKTHTIWGMLNVFYLVQCQHYYTTLLKKLVPKTQVDLNNYGYTSDENFDIKVEDIFKIMNHDLFCRLPKLFPKPRMLVCAPSNAATDELLARVLDRGFIDSEMNIYRPDVVRFGVDSQTNAAKTVSVERKTETLLAKGSFEISSRMNVLKDQEAQLEQQIDCLQREMYATAADDHPQVPETDEPDTITGSARNRATLLQNIAAAVKEREEIQVELFRLSIVEGTLKTQKKFSLAKARAILQASFVSEADIVFTTVSSSGHKLISGGFDLVVIDEAAQASELGVLPPLSLGASHCVLVGDPQQLPATIISKAAGKLLYGRSLFQRLQQAGFPTTLLSVQYRMHPQIRYFPSRYFYHGDVTDSDTVANMPDEIYHKYPLLRPYAFYNILNGRESHGNGFVSYENIEEAKFCLHIYEHLQKALKFLGCIKVSVGIITPYKQQLKCIQREFHKILNTEEGKELYINTVDAFQGQERDVIIMSCVRTSDRGVGFVSDIRRMNVALTRARRALWVVGNANALMQSNDWAALITDAKTRNCYHDMSSFPNDFHFQEGFLQHEEFEEQTLCEGLI